MTHLLAILIAMDAVTTYFVLRYGGRELNPLLAWLMARMGVVPALLATHALGIVLLYLYGLPNTAWLYGLCAAFAALAINNLLVIKRQRDDQSTTP